MALDGLFDYGIFFLIQTGIFAIMALGLNIQWGFTGLFNVGIAGFYAIGAYSSAILTTPANPDHFGGFGLPIVFGFGGAIITSAGIAIAVGLMTLRLRSDYLAIATIGIAEIMRLLLKNEEWLTNGVRGLGEIPSRLDFLVEGGSDLAYLLFIFALVGGVYFLAERAFISPWGRALRAIRENETAAQAMGKNIVKFRLQAFVFGAAIMGLAGAVYAHFVGFISPEAFDPLFATFLVWVMLIAGGSGNNRGAIFGALIIWLVWSGTEILTLNIVPDQFATQGAALRVLLIGVILQVILIIRPQGLLPEHVPTNSKK